jgi:hypothetical protein
MQRTTLPRWISSSRWNLGTAKLTQRCKSVLFWSVPKIKTWGGLLYQELVHLAESRLKDMTIHEWRHLLFSPLLVAIAEHWTCRFFKCMQRITLPRWISSSRWNFWAAKLLDWIDERRNCTNFNCMQRTAFPT